jgi:hypothetical protein
MAKQATGHDERATLILMAEAWRTQADESQADSASD